MTEKVSTRTTILEASIPLLARQGYAGTSMRDVAEAANIKASVIYHYFPDKSALLRAVRMHVNERLDSQMRALPEVSSVSEFLRQRLLFQLQRMEEIVALLQYFMAVKHDFPLRDGGYVPERAYRHMREIIERGIMENVYASGDVAFDAKVLTHLINGFLLEYYPHKMTEQVACQLVEQLAGFIERSLRYQEAI